MAVSSEKIALLTDLANEFNDSDAADLRGGKCAFVRVQVKASGAAMQLLTDGWPEPAANGPRPVVWSPAASSWGAILNQRLTEKGEPAMAPPVRAVHAHAARDRHAEADGGRPRLSRHPDRLRRHPPPRRTTRRAGVPTAIPSGARSCSARPTPTSRRARCRRRSRSTTPRRARPPASRSRTSNRPEVQQFARGVESAVVHYGDITMTFLNNWFRNDVRGTSLTYVSAVAVEEKSVIDYNKGNPDGMLVVGRGAARAARPARRRSTPRKARSTATTRSSCSTHPGSTATPAPVRSSSRSSSSGPKRSDG